MLVSRYNYILELSHHTEKPEDPSLEIPNLNPLSVNHLAEASEYVPFSLVAT